MRTSTTRIPIPWWLPPVVLVLVILALAPAPATAQHMGGADDVVQEYIERTDELIMWARDLVSETESGSARKVLRQADDMNRRASDQLGHGNSRQAGNMARRSRAAVWHAVKLAREAMGLQERLRVRAERFTELNRNLTERAQDLGHEGALDLLHQSEGQARRAREQYLQGDLRLAWQMFERAEDLMAMSARLLLETGDPEMLERELQRAEDQIEQVRERAGDDPPARVRQNLGEAEEALERARAHQSRGEPGRALQMVGLARRLVESVQAGPIGGEANAEAVERQMNRFDERYERVMVRLEDGGDDNARRLANQARDHRERAAAASGRGDDEEALRQIRAAHDLLEQAERMLR